MRVPMLATIHSWVPSLGQLRVEVHGDDTTSTALFRVSGLIIPKLAVTHAAISDYINSTWRGHVVRVTLAHGPKALEHAIFKRVYDDAILNGELLRFALRNMDYPIE